MKRDDHCENGGLDIDFLAENEKRFRQMFMNAPMPYQSLDENGNFLDVNEAFVRELGYSREELIGRNFGDILHPDWRDHFRENFPKFKAIGEILGIEFEMMKKDGSFILVSFNGRIQRDAQNRFQRTHCIFSDITEHRRVYEALRESEAKYRLLVENQSDMIVKVDTAGRFLFVSPSYCRTFGKTEAELLGRSFMPLVHEADREATARAMEALYHPPHTAYMEQRAMTKDGWKWLSWLDTAVLDDSGKVVEIIGVGRDITDRKQAEAKSRLLLEIIEKSLNEIYIFDADSLKFRYVNQGALKNLQYTIDDIRDMTPVDLKPEFTETTFRGMIAPLLSGKQEMLIFETVHRRADGTLYPVEIHLQLMDSEDGQVFLAVIFDITERKLAEAEREKLQEKLLQSQKLESIGRLAGGIAHDFNNMLGVILGYSEMAMDQLTSSHPLFECMKEIHKAAERSANLTRQLLGFARKQPIAPRVLDLNATIENMLQMLRRLIPENIDLRWHPGRNTWPVRIDPGQIDQVLVNLCTNARDAISGTGHLTIETGNRTFDAAYCSQNPEFAEGDYAMLAVSDDGCGMDEKTLNNLFEPFFTTKDVGQGTGMGLSLVYGIVRQNKGFIKVYSELGSGSTFRIYLPRHTETAEEPPKPGIPPEENIVMGRGETILLVEDEPAILSVAKIMLERIGYRVLDALDPDQAMAHAKTNPIDLLITDVIMPEMNGRELAARLRKTAPNMKALFMSGYTANVIAHRGILDKGVHFIQKPFSVKTLAIKVREAIEK
ncbi:PAS domain S-box protein [Desulfatirhabdium butyrativorans]|uniref:PAS domain S-box protein n=1 Tax=Desulfatirhabdium butyrativorans TaxID=340467 RepID=UPI00040B3D38|nr:PAS domain S-box protein [Desulfatirhabdium butyrativorans]